MASLTSPRLPYAETESKPQRSFPIERRPRMLKDFLSENSNSISSNGFKSFPRQSNVRHFLELDVKSDNVVTSKLLRSRSKAASTTISAIHKASEILINAVRHLPFVSVKSPSPSVSRRLLKREFWKKCRNDDVGQISVTVKVKDILRWRSFRDLVEEKEPPLDFSCSPYAGSTTSSNSYNWCESEFTAEYLPFWSTDSVEVGKKSLLEFGVGRDTMEATTGETVDPKGELLLEEKELHSPVSVHDFPFEEDEESFPSSFHQRLANMEENTCRFEQEGKEENSVKATSAAETCEANVDGSSAVGLL
uniref:Uncharacterized protein n=1 Tax=Davidia involucrata TaxID=16924 RepID=A0A5B7BQW2_DAVIN